MIARFSIFLVRAVTLPPASAREINQQKPNARRAVAGRYYGFPFNFPRASYSLTVICFGLASSALGSVTVRMPSL